MMVDIGWCMLVTAVGSTLATSICGMAAIGAWKKAYQLNKAAPFVMIAFVGAPLSQTIYALILRPAMRAATFDPGQYIQRTIMEIGTGFLLALSSWYMGRVGADACDAMGETGKGFGNYLMVIGVIETVSLFIFVSALTALPK